MRRFKAEDFARPVVQGMLNRSEVLMTEKVQIHALGQGLADQPIGVFIRSALPRVGGCLGSDTVLKRKLFLLEIHIKRLS
jgi:hypothetical protein